MFALFVTFFPQLVAGPIERAGHLLSSLRDLRNKLDNEMIISAVQLIILGFFKKLVIADRISSYVNEVYAFPSDFSGLNVAIATLFFALQIYCDFSGYSDIAIGSARLLGVKLMDNFKSPYFAQSISEFWSRWHISLSTWFRDYLYIPLGGNRVIKWRWYYNLFITFMVSGLWHGANWTFLFWGMLHGSYLVAGYLLRDFLGRNGVTLPARSDGWVGAARTLITCALVYFAWIFFRAQDMDDAFLVIRKILTLHTDLNRFTIGMTLFGVFSMVVSVASIIILFVYEWLLASRRFSNNHTFRIFASILLCCMTLLLGVMGSKSFIYFQF
jgi:D-alanyl-lipoteichoic acid acyltransferase DltB (MBOAT superfamily)